MAEQTPERLDQDEPLDRTEPEDDTEGHSLVTIELGNTMTDERRRDARKIEDSSRRHQALAPRRSLLDRLRGR
jgi:hypothetical protein